MLSQKTSPDTNAVMIQARRVHQVAITTYGVNLLRLSREELKNPSRFVAIAPNNVCGGQFGEVVQALLRPYEGADVSIDGLRVEQIQAGGISGTKVSIRFKKRGERKLLKLFDALPGHPSQFIMEISKSTETKIRGEDRNTFQAREPRAEPIRGDIHITSIRLFMEDVTNRGIRVSSGEGSCSYFSATGFRIDDERVMYKEQVKAFVKTVRDAFGGSSSGPLTRLMEDMRRAFEALPYEREWQLHLRGYDILKN